MTAATLERTTANFHPLHQPQIILGQVEGSHALVYPHGKIIEIRKSRGVIRLEVAYEESRRLEKAPGITRSEYTQHRNKSRDLHTRLHEERRRLLNAHGVHLDADDKMHVLQDHQYHRKYCLICVPA